METALRVGVAGPVGSGKTTLVDAQFLVRSQALPPERILGVETGGCPHTAWLRPLAQSWWI